MRLLFVLLVVLLFLQSMDLSLFIGADITKMDGIYSRHFCGISKEGAHHVTFTVTDTDGDTWVIERTYNATAVSGMMYE